ncbi:MAG TPA: DUF2523 domain-containing protein [Burkholderiaceae bacterium]
MWVAALWGALIQIVGTLVGRALISAGIGVIAYKGIDMSIAFAKTQFFNAANGLPSVSIQVLGLMQIDTAVAMLFSALVMRLTFKGMSSGVMKSFAVK